MRDVYIVGIDMLKFGRFQGVTPGELGAAHRVGQAVEEERHRHLKCTGDLVEL